MKNAIRRVGWLAAVWTVLALPLAAQRPIDPATGLAVEEWLPWDVARRLLAIEGFTLPAGESEYLAGALFDDMEPYLPEKRRIVASLQWSSGDLVLFDTDEALEDVIDDLIDRGQANGFELSVGGEWGFAENPTTFPLEFCSAAGRGLTVSGGDEAHDRADREVLELAVLLRPEAALACRKATTTLSNASKMPLPVLYAPRGVRVPLGGSSTSGLANRSKQQTMAAPKHEVIDLLSSFAVQMEEQGWFASPATDFGGAAAQMFTQHADAPDDDSIAGWLALIVLSRIDLESGEVAAQLSVRRVVQKAP